MHSNFLMLKNHRLLPKNFLHPSCPLLAKSKKISTVLCQSQHGNFEHSKQGITRKVMQVSKSCASVRAAQTSSSCLPSKSCGESTERRLNPIGIQMLSSNLYNQIFKEKTTSKESISESSLQRCSNHLKEQNLWGKKNTENVDVKLKLPELLGKDLDDHFRTIAEEQIKPYKELLHKITHTQLPRVPQVFAYKEGWTKYLPDGTCIAVDVPECDAFVFDVEVSVLNGNQPTLAAAVSDKFWYTWCSRQLLANGATSKEISSPPGHNAVATESTQDRIPTLGEDSSDAQLDLQVKGSHMELDDLIPFGGGDPKSYKNSSQKSKIIVGHNVSYDRVRVKEQYYVPDYPLRFIDTMSLHIAVSGLVQEQRAMIMKNKTLSKKVYLPWMSVGSVNNLNDVYKFYCKTKGLQKETRDVFVTGTLKDIRDDFQNLMAYCTKDVIATHDVLVNLLPLFYERCPHPVSFGGILEMGSSYLPVCNSWDRYIERAERQYSKMQTALTEKLSERAVEALKLKDDKLYENDPWLWNLDWSVMMKFKTKGKNTPNWYVKLCKTTGEREGTPEPANMSTSLRVVPKLLRLTWKNYPLHHEKDFGWGYLRPKYPTYQHFMAACDQMQSDSTARSSAENVKFPIEEFYSICPVITPTETNKVASDLPETQADWEQILYGVPSSTKLSKAAKSQTVESTEDNPIDIGIPGVEFIRLPHKNGPRHNVGNPLAKDFLHKIEDGTLSSHIREVAELVLKTTKSISYWRNSRDRILSQNTVWLDEHHLPTSTLHSEEFNNEDPECKWGAILPQVVVCGTITRRAVEKTWLTASNARVDRIGSELKSMVTAPPGYHFVGADVDSQELWIAALLGDAFFAGVHGGTAMAWMTLQGTKAEGTDLHSKTAATAHITRDQAKVINYGRIYGAGLRFLQTLLLQYNPSLSPTLARQRAEAIMTSTKGEKGWWLNAEGKHAVLEHLGEDVGDRPLTRKELNVLLRRLMKKSELYMSFANVTESPAVWVNGSESFTFNCLESIVRQKRPVSPVLGAAIPKPLEPEYAGTHHMTSRMNWVVQSSAVDYLHLMTVCMRWLAQRYDIDMRFSISIHDEVRYLVASKDRYRAALALQITNLLTRSLFALRVGMPDLPLAVAFFSSVDIDKVLRKDPLDSCITPSNPEGLEKTYGIRNGEPLTIYQLLNIVESLERKNE